MLYAEIGRTGKVIPAEKASSYGDYRCPTCRAEVFLKGGRIYARHFAHMPGQGKQECDEYHPPEHLRRQWETPSPQPVPQKIDRLLLGIELEPDQDARHGRRRWSLRLTVPKSHDSHGEIRIDLGGGDVRRVPLTTLSLGAQTYRADPGARDFGASWVSHDVRPEYRQAVEHRIDGLTAVRVTVFAAVPQKFKPRCSAVRWGENYYFVWRSGSSIEPPPSLLRHAFADNYGWSCCLLSLPDNSDSDVGAWLEKACDLQVVPARREWALIYPPPHGFDEHGNVQVHSAAALLLAIKPVADAGEIICMSGQYAGSLQLTGARRHLVEIGLGQQTPARLIHLTWDAMPLNSLVAAPYFEAATEPAVLVEFGFGLHKTRIPLHRASCNAELMRVRTSEQQISAVHADPRVRGKLLFRRAGKFDWQSEDLIGSQPDALQPTDATFLSTTHIGRLNLVLKDRSLDVVVDFGSYGAFHANASVASGQLRARLPRRLRGRIEWLCKAARAFVDGQRRPIHTIDDAALLRHLTALRTPVSLLANRRAVERDLRRIKRSLRI
jgi:hypothetical protein